MRAGMTGLAVATFLVFASSFLRPDLGWAQSTAQPSAVVPIGKVVTAAGTITIEHPNAVVVQASLGGSDRTKVGDPVYLGDVVYTGADGRLGITFNDGTAFTLSSNARMVLNDFVYDPNGKSNSTLFSLTKGTFTFVAGKVAKTGNMKIDTPVATMGIRGTTPHVEVSDDGTVKFSTLIEEGKSRATDKQGIFVRQRQAKAGSSSGENKVPQPQQKRDGELNLSICRGC
jgi:hypothetical protein